MVDNSRDVRRQIFDVVGCLAAVITVLVYLVLCINTKWAFIPEGSFILDVLKAIKTFAPLVVVGLVGIEFMADKHWVFRIIFYVMLGLIVLMMFFPGVFDEFIGKSKEIADVVTKK